jgi:MFS family permease
VRFLRSTSFRWLWVATLGFGAAQPLEATATAWLALQTGGPFAVGLALAARAIPRLLFGLASGTIADHIDRRRVVLISAVLGAFVMTAIGWLLGLVEAGPWHTVAFAFAGGSVQVLNIPARQALVPDTVEHAAAPNALAAVSLSENVSKAGGAIAAGLLIATFGTAASYLVSGAAYAFAALFVLPLRVTRSEHGDIVQVTYGRALLDAVRVVLDVPAIRTLALAAIAAEVFAYSHLSAVPVLVRDSLSAGPEALGAVSASFSIGATASLVALSVLPSRIRRDGMLGVVFAAYGLSLIAFGASPNVAVATAIAFIVGVCGGAFDSLQQVLMQLAVPVGQRGRAASIWVASTGSGVLGHLETGALTTLLGAPRAMGLNGAIVVCAAVLLLAVAPSHRPPRIPARVRLRRPDIIR